MTPVDAYETTEHQFRIASPSHAGREQSGFDRAFLMRSREVSGVIVTDLHDSYRFVTQPDHAALAGELAEHWGNSSFDRPAPEAEVLIAAFTHDAGWVTYDRRPHLEDGRPVDFRGMTAETWIDLYETGIDEVVQLDAYAGLVVSMHGAGLRRRRYGLSPAWPATPSDYAGFVERQEALQRRLCEQLRAADRLSATDAAVLSELHESGAIEGDHESRLWTNYKRLQAWDALSLSLCLAGPDPSATEIEAVPRGDSRADTAISIEPGSADEFHLSPYPFEQAPLIVSVPTRTVRKDAFDDEQSLLRAYYRAERERRTITLSSGE